jgi:circadian clock protein KaiC
MEMPVENVAAEKPPRAIKTIPITNAERVSSGIPGLDDILGGGYPVQRIVLVTGAPGVGKTTLGLQFLLEGAQQGEACLYITLSESRSELTACAASHGWSMDGVSIFEASSAEEQEMQDGHYTFFHPEEVELGDMSKTLINEINRVKPVRMVLDSLSELKLIARDPLRFRRTILSLKKSLMERQCSVLMLDPQMTGGDNLQLQSLAHAVIALETTFPEYGSDHHSLSVLKMRGMTYRGGGHDFKIQTGGIVVYPRLVASESNLPTLENTTFKRPTSSNGLPEFDSLLGGGLTRGSSVIIMGPAGAGKSSVAAQCARAAVHRFEKTAVFLFDETLESYLERAESQGCDFRESIASGLLCPKHIDPAELSPGEFIQSVVDVVRQGVTTVVIDSLNGYHNAMASDKALMLQFHELLTYLGHKGVVTIVILGQHGFIGATLMSPIDISYLADSVVLLRFFESDGHVRKAISVIKKRTGYHETSVREFGLSMHGLQIGEPIKGFRGILSGHDGETGEFRGRELIHGRSVETLQ